MKANQTCSGAHVPESAVGPPGQRAYYTPRELSAKLPYCLGTIYVKLRSGEIPSMRLGGRRFVIPRAAFDKWFESLGEAL